METWFESFFHFQKWETHIYYSPFLLPEKRNDEATTQRNISLSKLQPWHLKGETDAQDLFIGTMQPKLLDLAEIHSIWQQFSSRSRSHELKFTSTPHSWEHDTSDSFQPASTLCLTWKSFLIGDDKLSVICNLNIWFFHIFVVISKRCIFQETHQNFPRLDFPFTLCVRGTLTKEKRQNSLEWREERGEREEVTGGTDGRRKEALRILMN